MPEAQAQAYVAAIAQSKDEGAGSMLQALHRLRGLSLHPVWPHRKTAEIATCPPWPIRHADLSVSRESAGRCSKGDRRGKSRRTYMNLQDEYGSKLTDSPNRPLNGARSVN